MGTAQTPRAQVGEAAREVPRHGVLGTAFDYLPPGELVRAILERAAQAERGYCCVLDVAQCVLAHDDPAHRKILAEASFVTSDSTVLQRVRSFVHRVPFFQPMFGAELMLSLCRAAAEKSVPIALVGGRDERALDALKRHLVESCPGLAIAYAWSPPFRPLTEDETREMLEGIRASGSRLVFVGLGCPKQERFMAAHKDGIDAFMIGVGAAFDYNAGIIAPLPNVVHRLGMGWLWRMMSEPRRLWRRYFVLAPRFIWLLSIDRMGTGVR